MAGRFIVEFYRDLRASEIDSYSRVPERVNSPGISGLADIGFVKEMSIPENKPDIQFVIAKSKSRSEKTEKKYKMDPQIIDFP